jgi:hypothetical protein
MQFQELVTIIYTSIRMGIAVELHRLMELQILPIQKLAYHLKLLILQRSKHAGKAIQIALP